MKVVEIPVADIDATGRVRPVHAAVVAQLAADIAARGLRQPIEVARRQKGKGWKLVSGAHRLEAASALGWKTIAAVEVSGKAVSLRWDELMENLARNELSKLERIQFLGELIRVHHEMHPESRRGVAGGHARQDSARDILSFAETIAIRTGWHEKTISRAAAIGLRLDAKAADTIRGTVLEDNQSEIDLLSKNPPAEQRDIARMIRQGGRNGRSVRAALLALAGHPDPQFIDPAAKWAAKLLDAWRRSPRAAHRQVIRQLTGAEKAEIISYLTDAEFDELVEPRRGEAV